MKPRFLLFLLGECGFAFAGLALTPLRAATDAPGHSADAAFVSPDDGDAAAPSAQPHKGSGDHDQAAVSVGGSDAVRVDVGDTRDGDAVGIMTDVVVDGHANKNAVAVMGDTTVNGQVDNDAVAVMGDNTINGQVNHDAVAVMGDLAVKGHVDHDAVAVMGDHTINGRVDHDAVAVMGDLTLGPKAWIGHDAVCVGGQLHKDPHAHVGGQTVRQSFLGANLGHLGRHLGPWWRDGLGRCRVISFRQDLAWTWIGGLLGLGLCALMGLAMPGPTKTCGDLLAHRPGRVILTGFLTLLALPFLFVLLCASLVGLPVAFMVLPVALVLFTTFGAASIYALVGRSISQDRLHPAAAILAGGVVFLAIYAVPVLGLPVFLLMGFLGLGCAVSAVFTSRRPAARPPHSAGPTSAAPMASSPLVSPAIPTASATPAPGSPGVSAGPAIEMPPPPAAMPETATPLTIPSSPEAAIPPPISVSPATGTPPPAAPAMAATAPASVSAPAGPITADLERAGFWIRTLALAIDWIVVAVVWHLLGDFFRPALWFFPLHRIVYDGDHTSLLVIAAYAAVLWKVKGSTVGGLICNLHVVRLDGRPIDWPTAVVRALGCFLSLIAVGLGFIWVAFDPERQSWHDKIAGTTVVYTRARRSLI